MKRQLFSILTIMAAAATCTATAASLPAPAQTENHAADTKNTANKKLKLPKSKLEIIGQVYEDIVKMPDFTTEDIAANDDYNLPDFLGKGRISISTNPESKAEAMSAINMIPHIYQVQSRRDKQGNLIRLFLDPRDRKNPILFYYIESKETGEQKAFFFQKGDLKKIQEWLKEQKQSHTPADGAK